MKHPMLIIDATDDQVVVTGKRAVMERAMDLSLLRYIEIDGFIRAEMIDPVPYRVGRWRMQDCAAEHRTDRTYPVLCAWCEKEGRETVLGWIGVEGSHGICPAHRAELRKEAERIRHDRVE